MTALTVVATPTPSQERRLEWLRWRRLGIGATDIAGIVGLSPWSSPYEVWAEKTGRLELELADDNDYQEFGRRAETMLGPWFHDVTGLYLRKYQHRATHPVWPVARCTADALVYRSKRSAAPLGVAEMKTTGRQRDWDELPDHIECQIQWQMLVCDVDQAWVPALHERRFRAYHVERSAEDGAYLMREARRFWADHVLAGVAPPADAHRATTSALSRIERHPTPAVELDKLRPVLDAYAVAKRHQAASKATADGLANQIKAALGDFEVGTVAGVDVVRYPQRHRRSHHVEASSYRALDVRWKDPSE